MIPNLKLIPTFDWNEMFCDKNRDERCVRGVTLRAVPAGSPTSPIKAGKWVVTADVLPGPTDTSKLICWFVSPRRLRDRTCTHALLRPPAALFVLVCIPEPLSRLRVIRRIKRKVAKSEGCAHVWVCVRACVWRYLINNNSSPHLSRIC